MKQRIIAAAGADVGKYRENNEDNFYFNGIFLTEETRDKAVEYAALCRDKRQFYAVCDGMGGEQWGELASLIAVETIHKHADLLKSAAGKKDKKDMDAEVERCIREANKLICEAQKERGANRIGTTLTLLAVEGRTAALYNIGDSRIYLFRKGKLTLLSEDHTAVASSVRLGILTPEQAKVHPHRNRLTQYVGIDPEEMIIEAHKSTVKMKNNDIFLLCSDGITDMLEEPEISRIMTEAKSPSETARRLVDGALAHKGKDNIAVIVLEYKRAMW